MAWRDGREVVVGRGSSVGERCLGSKIEWGEGE